MTNEHILFQLEHENRMLKDRLKTYRGTYTQAHLDRVSKGRIVLKKVVERLDDSTGFHARTSRRSNEKHTKDVSILVQNYSGEKLFEDMTQMRTHSTALLTIPRNPLAGISGKSLRDWISGRIQMAQVRHYYRQFSEVASSFNDQSYSIIYPADFSITLRDVVLWA